MTFTARTGADRHVHTTCDRCGATSWHINVRLADMWRRKHRCRKDTP